MMLLKNAPISAKIGIIAVTLQITIGVCLGLVSALNRGKLGDHIIRACVVLAICIPSFVFAALLQYFYSLQVEASSCIWLGTS